PKHDSKPAHGSKPERWGFSAGFNQDQFVAEGQYVLLDMPLSGPLFYPFLFWELYPFARAFGEVKIDPTAKTGIEAELGLEGGADLTVGVGNPHIAGGGVGGGAKFKGAGVYKDYTDRQQEEMGAGPEGREKFHVALEASAEMECFAQLILLGNWHIKHVFG